MAAIWYPSWIGLPKKAPLTGPTSVVAKRPVMKAPTQPPMPCLGGVRFKPCDCGGTGNKHGKGVERVVVAELVLDLDGGVAEGADEDANDERAPRVDVAARGRDGDEADAAC